MKTKINIINNKNQPILLTWLYLQAKVTVT